MPFLEAGDLRIHYSASGASNAPVVVFSNSLGTNLSMWDPQAAALEPKFRLLRYDTRGHGQTAVTPGPYSIEQLGRDVLALLDALGLDRIYFCGLSLGGMTGMWLGINAPARLGKLVLCNTAAKIGTARVWNARIDSVRTFGMSSVVPGVLERWFTPEFRARSPQVVASVRKMLETTSPEGYVGCSAAVRDMDQREAISTIRVPTLVITGARDSATPPAEGRFVAGRIAGAQHAGLPAAHLSNLEASEQFTSELLRFLDV